MLKNVNISLIGAPEIGKTSFICTLLEEKAALQLKNTILENKPEILPNDISMYYTLVNPDLYNNISIAYIEFNYSILGDLLFKSEKPPSSTLKKFLSLFKFPDLLPLIDKWGIDKINDYKKIFENISFQDFLEKYIYNSEISNANLIHHIRLEVPASRELWNLISINRFDSITFREYIWFDSIEHIINSEKQSFTDTKYYDYLKFDSTHAYIFFYDDIKGLPLKYKKLYNSLISDSMKSRPTFICKRSAILTDNLFDKLIHINSINDLTIADYYKFQETAMIKNHYPNFKDVEDKFIASIIAKDITNSNIDYYYHRVLLPAVDFSSEINNLSKYREIYKYIVHCVFQELIKFLIEYYVIKSFYRKHTQDITTTITNAYIKNFRITTYISYTEYVVYFYPAMKKISFSGIIDLANQIKNKNFYGGIVGVQGGFTNPEYPWGKNLLDLTYGLLHCFLRHRMVILCETTEENLQDEMGIISLNIIYDAIEEIVTKENHLLYEYIDKHVNNKVLVHLILDEICKYLDSNLNENLHYSDSHSNKDSLCYNLSIAFDATVKDLPNIELPKANNPNFIYLQSIPQTSDFCISTLEAEQLEEGLALIENITSHLVNIFLRDMGYYLPELLHP